jgi:hypothetical protein
MPDASDQDAAPRDAGSTRWNDAAIVDAAADRDAAVGGGGGGAGRSEAGTGGEGGGATGGGGGSAGSDVADDDAGLDIDQAVGDTGLHVSDILGFYSGDWGEMMLRKVDAEIWGAYQYEGGTIVGNIQSDGVFVGWWTQMPTRTGSDAGEVEFRWSQASGTPVMLDGRWRYGTTGEWLENWDIDRVTDRPAPMPLSDRFNHPIDFKRHP